MKYGSFILELHDIGGYSAMLRNKGGGGWQLTSVVGIAGGGQGAGGGTLGKHCTVDTQHLLSIGL